MIDLYNLFFKIINKILRLKFLVSIKVFYMVLTNNFSKYPNYLINFENKLAKKFNSKYCLSFSSGTAAFYAALLSLNLPKKTNVLISNLTFPSTIKVLKILDYEITMFECDKNFQPILNKNFLEKKFDLIIITHPFGFIVKPENYKILMSPKTKLIFDCSHTHGLEYNKKFLNEFADLSFMSLQGQKAISGGEGGVVLTNNKDYYQKMINLNHPGHSMNNLSKDFTGISKDLKLRMHPLAAIIASEDLKGIHNKNKKLRKKIKKIYNFLLIKKNLEIKDINHNETGGYHYGIPIYFRDITIQNINWPLLKLNWPLNYDLDYNSLANNENNVFDNILFIDLNWIKNNSFLYIKSKLDLLIK